MSADTSTAVPATTTETAAADSNTTATVSHSSMATAQPTAQLSVPQYPHGHQAAVLKAYSHRTAANSAAYLLPLLQSHYSLLDIGCGFGSITCDFADILSEGHVTGIDAADSAIKEGIKLANQRQLSNCDFRVADATALPFADESFDVVHAHQVLLHLPDPVAVLKEMRRVLKPNGIIACKTAICGCIHHYPPSPALDEWKRIYMSVCRHTGAEPNGGDRQHAWARQAGFDEPHIDVSSSSWCHRSAADREWWAETWNERVRSGSFPTTAIQSGETTQQQLEEIAHAFEQWKQHPDAAVFALHGEMIARKVFDRAL